MKARDLDPGALLHLDPHAGRLYLHQRRVLIMNADALGMLRKDLISNLGLERAKGFLIRYGWSCGYHDALAMRGRYSWDNEMEWLRAAPALNTLEGFAQVKVQRSEVDKDRGHLWVEGTWAHSFEAEQHIHHFGVADEPVCWTLSGYAGGYLTAFMGQRVIFRETACAGRGDPICRVVGKTVVEWGPAVQAELPFYEESRIAQELEQAYQEIQHQNQQLRQANAIHEELTRLILEGKSIPEITATLSRLLDSPVAVEDTGYRLLAAHPAGSFPHPRTGGAGPVGLAAGRADLGREIAILKGTLRPRLLQPMPAWGLPGPWLATPVVAGGRILAYLSLLRVAGPPEPLVTALERAAAVYALELLKQRAVAAAESRILVDLIASLLHGDFADEELMARRLRHVGIEAAVPHRVAVVEASAPARLTAEPPRDQDQLEEQQKPLVRHIRDVLEKTVPGSSVAVQSDQITLLVRLPGDPDDRAPLTLLHQRLREAPGTGIRIGVGPVCRRAQEYALSYRRAREALEILRSFERTDAMLLYEDLGPYAIAFNREGRAELMSWVQRLLGPLLDYDQRRGGDLVRTLETYLAHDCSQAATARKMALHPSGLKYRLTRIRELLDVDFTRTEVRLQLHLVLLAARLARGQS